MDEVAISTGFERIANQQIIEQNDRCFDTNLKGVKIKIFMESKNGKSNTSKTNNAVKTIEQQLKRKAIDRRCYK